MLKVTNKLAEKAINDAVQSKDGILIQMEGGTVVKFIPYTFIPQVSSTDDVCVSGIAYQRVGREFNKQGYNTDLYLRRRGTEEAFAEIETLNAV